MIPEFIMKITGMSKTAMVVFLYTVWFEKTAARLLAEVVMERASELIAESNEANSAADIKRTNTDNRDA